MASRLGPKGRVSTSHFPFALLLWPCFFLLYFLFLFSDLFNFFFNLCLLFLIHHSFNFFFNYFNIHFSFIILYYHISFNFFKRCIINFILYSNYTKIHFLIPIQFIFPLIFCFNFLFNFHFSFKNNCVVVIFIS